MKKLKIPYDEDTALKLINKIRKGLCGDCEKEKVQLFYMLESYVEKGINFYKKMYYNSILRESKELDEEGLYSESYIILDRCINNFDYKKSTKFFLYFNKSLSQHFYLKFVNERFRTKKFEEVIKEVNYFRDKNQGINENLDDIIDGYGFTDEEKQVINLLINGYKKKDIKELLEGINLNKVINNIKNKLKNV